MPVGESRDKKGQPPKATVSYFGGEFRPVRQASGGNLDYKAQAPLPDAIGIKQTSGFDRRIGDRERGRRNRCADGSDAANPRPIAAPDRVHRGTCESETAQRESEGTPRENPTAPTALLRGHGLAPFPAPQSLWRRLTPCPRCCKIRAVAAGAAGVRNYLAAAPAGPAPFGIARPL